jgi:hypothetical protein
MNDCAALLAIFAHAKRGITLRHRLGASSQFAIRPDYDRRRRYPCPHATQELVSLYLHS